MRIKRSKPSYQLTFDDAVKVWHLLWKGEIQSRIAAMFDVNQGRVSEVKTGLLHPNSEQVARGLLN